MPLSARLSNYPRLCIGSPLATVSIHSSLLPTLEITSNCMLTSGMESLINKRNAIHAQSVIAMGLTLSHRLVASTDQHSPTDAIR